MTQYDNSTDDQGEGNNARRDTPSITYRSRVRSLLGVPAARDAIVTRQTTPPVGFEYPDSPVRGTFPAHAVLPEPFAMETGLPSLEGEAFAENADAPQMPPENAYRDAETPARQETNLRPSYEQPESPDNPDFGVSLDMPDPVRRRDDSPASRETFHPQVDSVRDNDFTETVEEEVSIEQVFQEFSSRQQFNLDIPGISDRLISFPALNDDTEGVNELEDNSQQRPPREGSADEDLRGTRGSMPMPRSLEPRNDRPQRRQTSDFEVEGTTLPSPETSRDLQSRRSGAESHVTPVNRNSDNQRSDASEQGIADAGQNVDQSPPDMPAVEDRQTSSDEWRFSPNVQDIRRQPETVRTNGLDSHEADRLSGLRYLNDNGVNGSYQNAMEQIEQLRSSMRQLTARDASQSQSNRRDQEREQQQVNQPAPRPIVLVQRAAGSSRIPRAFWERRYLNHFRLRTLR